MPLADLIKDVQAKKAKAVSDRLKKEKPNQKYVPNAKEPSIFHTPLHEAVRVADAAVVEALLAGGADVSGVDMHNNTPLHWAARSSNTEAAVIAGGCWWDGMHTMQLGRGKDMVLSSTGVDVFICRVLMSGVPAHTCGVTCTFHPSEHGTAPAGMQCACCNTCRPDASRPAPYSAAWGTLRASACDAAFAWSCVPLPACLT